MFKKASIALLIIVLFMISSIGFAGVRQNPEIIYELGIKAFQSHDYVKAIELMEGAIKLGLSGSKVDNAREIIKNSNRIKFMANKKDAALLDIALYLVDSVNVSNDGTRRKKADMELKVARYLISINKDKEAKDLISDALNLGRQIKEPSYSWLKAQIQADAAIAMLDLGDKNQALEITKSIETYYMKDIANKEIAILLSKKGKIPEAMEKINNIQSTLVTAEAFVGIAAELSKNGKKSEAFNFLKQAVETNKSKVIDRDKGQAYIVIAEGFRKTGKINEYEVNMERAYEVFKLWPGYGDAEDKAILLSMIAFNYWYWGADYSQKVNELIPQMQVAADAISRDYGKQLIYAQIAVLYYMLGHKDKANNIFNSFTYAQIQSGKRLKYRGLGQIAINLARRDNFNAALDVAKTIEDEDQKRFSIGTIAQFQARKDYFDEAIQTIDLLTPNKEDAIFEVVLLALNNANKNKQARLASQIMDRLR